MDALDEVVPAGKHYMAELNHTGDTKTIWDPDNADEVEIAKDQFDKFIKLGYAAFKAEGKEGTQGEKIKKFDKNLARIIFVKPLQGG